jgi:large subunit ribosomal protein L37Ae
MYSHTKKVGSLGKYGTRIGRKVRDEILQMENLKKENICRDCGKKLKREAAGIWECKSCGTKFTGGAYSPTVRGE